MKNISQWALFSRQKTHQKRNGQILDGEVERKNTLKPVLKRGLTNMRVGGSYFESENEDEGQADSLNNQAWQFYSVGRSQKRIKYSLFSYEIATLRSQ